VSSIQASSGKTTRHRLNRSGDRQANHALWRIALTRMRNDRRTRVYVERRTAEGKSKLEILRILKRYIAREVYPLLPRPDPTDPERRALTRHQPADTNTVSPSICRPSAPPASPRRRPTLMTS
jgi:hypothetical protein